MTGKNFYTFNILIEFESISAFRHVLVSAREFASWRAYPSRRWGTIAATMRCLGKSGEVCPPRAINAWQLGIYLAL
jgi:hypothetical protein